MHPYRKRYEAMSTESVPVDAMSRVKSSTSPAEPAGPGKIQSRLRGLAALGLLVLLGTWLAYLATPAAKDTHEQWTLVGTRGGSQVHLYLPGETRGGPVAGACAIFSTSPVTFQVRHSILTLENGEERVVPRNASAVLVPGEGHPIVLSTPLRAELIYQIVSRARKGDPVDFSVWLATPQVRQAIARSEGKLQEFLASFAAAD